MPLGPPVNTEPATAPTGTAYVLDSSFDINDDAVTRTYNWVIAMFMFFSDGYNRSYITINGQTPGPLIEANEGDTLVINVQNNLNDNQTSSIHWHGIYQNGTQYMDGVPGATQCPIQPGQNFSYQFKLEQYGTYWYHSHSSVQYTDGLMGPLVVHSVDDPLVRGTDFDNEQVLMVYDWYHDEASTIVNELLSSDGYEGTSAAPSPQSGLINGQGVYDCSLLDDDSSANCTTPTSYPVFNVETGKKTRFRLINAGSHAQFYFSVDEHTVQVIEADGTPVSGSGDLHRIPFHNGQRYSALVDASVGSEGDGFWMRFTMNTDCFSWVDDTLNATALAIMRYGSSSDSDTDPTTSDWSDTIGSSCVDLDEGLLVPVVEKDAVDSQAVVAFDSAFGTISYNGEEYGRFFVNDTTYTNYIYHPVLLGVASDGTDYLDTEENVTYAVFDDDVWSGDIIVSLTRKDAALDHPYHLHGYDFQIVARGTGELSIADAANIEYNTTNPLRRDTLVIPGGSYAVLRFGNDNPGAWVLHCHIAWHLAEGFLGMVISKPNAIADIDFPDSVNDLCSSRPDFVDEDTTEPGRRRRRRALPPNVAGAQPEVSPAPKAPLLINKMPRGHSAWSRRRGGSSSL
ncbi:hypothetical protein K435DRAFT_672475 [Dendrothele bispora CBS 962.96]|uniref:Multicopper oxidase n=1 Tax=Dendrothele bispora (strain CBS 962.96) TaxID=1314807 RepID=A0A4S8LRY1_DENBC|nr:hypothetical protein K435DRAFT_672475 [Dendrothele bispora CBS 962.96]